MYKFISHSTVVFRIDAIVLGDLQSCDWQGEEVNGKICCIKSNTPVFQLIIMSSFHSDHQSVSWFSHVVLIIASYVA